MLDRLKSLAYAKLNNPFLRQVSNMMGLTVLGQGVYLITAPLIGRIYSPEQFGHYALFLTILMTAGGVVCFMYDSAIPVAENEDDARDLTVASIAIGLMLSVVFGLILTSAIWWGASWTGKLPLWAGLLLVLGLLAQIASQLAQNWCVRWGDVLRIGRASITLNFVRGFAQIMLGLLHPLWTTLISSEILARAINALQLYTRRPQRHWQTKVKLQKILAAIRHYRHIPIVLGPALVLETAAQIIQTAMLGAFFGPAALGQYFLMRRTLDLPVSFAFKSLSDLFYARQIDDTINAPHRVKPFFIRAGLGLAALGLIAGLPLILFGPKLFAIVYGAEWEIAGALSAAMVPAMALNLAVAPVSRVFLLSLHTQLRLVPSIVINLATITVFWYTWRYSLSLYQTTVGLSLAICFQYAVYFVAGYFAAGKLKTM